MAASVNELYLLNVNFTAPSAGLYYFKFSGSYEYNAVDYSHSYSGAFNSSTSKIYSEGLDVKVISPSSLTVGSNDDDDDSPDITDDDRGEPCEDRANV